MLVREIAVHLREIDTITYLPLAQTRGPYPLGLVQLMWVAAPNTPDIRRSGYLDYYGSTFAGDMRLARKAISTVFKLEQVLEFTSEDIKHLKEALALIDREDREFGAWTMVVYGREIFVAFSRARDAVEFQLCLPVSTEA